MIHEFFLRQRFPKAFTILDLYDALSKAKDNTQNLKGALLAIRIAEQDECLVFD
jgi:hypothetical protein